MFPLPMSHLARLLGQESSSATLVFEAFVDSRKKGDLFFALPGAKQDGHQFLKEVKEKGAVAAVVHKSYQGPHFGLELLPVADVLEALQNLARLCLRQMKPQVVAVTGSMGKTTTKDFLTELLKTRYRVFSSPGNANSQIGLPLSLLSLRGDEEIVVLEMGMTEKGHIKNLVSIAPPDLALITTVDLVHAVNFTGLEQIAQAKAEIFSYPQTRYCLYSADMPYVNTILASGTGEKIAFSTKSLETPFFAEEKGGRLFIYERGVKVLQSPWHIRGKHNVHNFLAAASAARLLGVPWQDIETTISCLKLPHERLELVQKGSLVFLKDAYNANKMSLKSAFESLEELAQGRRKVAVISEVLELGAFAQSEHEEIGRAALEKVDALYCIGEETLVIKQLFDKAQKPCYYFTNKEELVHALKKELQEEDTILIKGSRRYNLGDLVEHF